MSKFRRKSINTQLRFLAFTLGVALFLICLFINRSIQEAIYLNEDDHTLVTAQTLENQLDLMYGKMQAFSINLCEDEEILQVFRNPIQKKAAYIMDMEKKLSQYQVLEPMIQDISLVNPSTHYSRIYHYDTLDDMASQVAQTNFRWLGVRRQDYRDMQQEAPMFVYAGVSFWEGERIGTAILSISPDFLQVEEAGGSSYYALVSAEGMLYPINCPEEKQAELFQIWQEDPEASLRRAGHYYVHSSYYPKMDCYLVSLLDTARVSRSLGGASSLIWLCVALLWLAFVLLVAAVNRGFVNPLNQFYRVIRNLRDSGQRRLKESLGLEGCREMEEIGEEFQGMLEGIDTMNKRILDNAAKLYEMDIQKKQAELAYLRSQIDPHFLYNTLEVVRQMALAEGIPKIADVALDMGKIFRYSAKGELEVALEEEISIIKSYIRIQQLRFPDKLRVHYFISQEARKAPILKMLIQPLVENAIFHGLEPSNQDGNLFIGARLEDGVLQITVKDDGIGIPREKLQEIQANLDSGTGDTSKSVGIYNTDGRIRLFYGEGCGLTVDSSTQDGTTVTLRLKQREGGRKAEGNRGNGEGNGGKAGA